MSELTMPLVARAILSCWWVVVVDGGGGGHGCAPGQRRQRAHRNARNAHGHGNVTEHGNEHGNEHGIEHGNKYSYCMELSMELSMAIAWN